MEYEQNALGFQWYSPPLVLSGIFQFFLSVLLDLASIGLLPLENRHVFSVGSDSE
jgi:hypothetical protein